MKDSHRALGEAFSAQESRWSMGLEKPVGIPRASYAGPSSTDLI